MSINQAKIGFLGLYLTTPSHNKREESPYSELLKDSYSDYA